MAEKEFTHEAVIEKVTPNTTRFKEVVPPGEPPIFKTIYLADWWVGDGQRIRVTVEVIE